MNEITRIHIAKIPYNIEPAAKRQLSGYLDELRTSLGDDDEMINDIEIRMTELLRDRSVKADGTIDTQDITALKKQLGEPSDFTDDDPAEAATTVERTGRKLFRDPRGAWAGGILQGLATASNLPVWLMRLVMAGLTLLSHGIVAAVYVAMWLVIPRAKSPADILRLEARPVTAANMRSVGQVPKGRDAAYLKALRITAGIVSIIFALTAVVGASVLAYKYNSPANYYGFRSLHNTVGYNLTYWHWALGLFIAFGVMAAAFFAALAFSALAKRLTRRIVSLIAVLAVVAFGLLVSALVLVHYQERKYDSYVQQHTITKKIDLPVTDFRNLVANVPDSSFTYQVTAGRPYAEYKFSDLAGNNTPPVITGTDGTLAVTFQQAHPGTDMNNYLTLYGPALKTVRVNSGSLDYVGNQIDLDVDVQPQAGLNLNGDIGALTGSIGSNANLYSSFDSDHDLAHAVLRVGDNASINLQAVAFLDVTFSDTCSSSANVYAGVLGNQNGSLKVNGKTLPAANAQTVCGIVSVNATGEL